MEVGSSRVVRCLWVGCAASGPFTNDEALFEHLAAVHFTPGRPFHCLWQSCQRESSISGRKSGLGHLMTHTRYRPYACSVTGCRFTAIRLEDLAQHTKRHSNTGRIAKSTTSEGSLSKQLPQVPSSVKGQYPVERPSMAMGVGRVKRVNGDSEGGAADRKKKPCPDREVGLRCNASTLPTQTIPIHAQIRETGPTETFLYFGSARAGVSHTTEPSRLLGPRKALQITDEAENDEDWAFYR